MFEVLKQFNFGEDLISWVKTCYSNIYSTIINNEYTGGWFQITKGMRQGCPLSSTLFVLCAEILAQHIIRNKNMAGLNIGDTQVRLVQFADDMSCFVGNEESIEILFNTCEFFSKISGLSLNKEKSLIIWLGP